MDKPTTSTETAKSTLNDSPEDQSVYLTSDINQCRRLIGILKTHCDEFNVLGLDCEWISEGKVRRPVALLQLASHRGFCVLIQLCHMPAIPKELLELLVDDKIIKVGVETKRDAEFLFKDYDMVVENTFDLRFMAEIAGCQSGGLGKMSEDYLKIKMNKANWTIHSRWEAYTLYQREIEYAAKDVRTIQVVR